MKSKNLWIPQHLSSTTEIDGYANYLTQFIEKVVESTVPWIKNGGKAESWWSDNVAKAVEEY